MDGSFSHTISARVSSDKWLVPALNEAPCHRVIQRVQEEQGKRGTMQVEKRRWRCLQAPLASYFKWFFMSFMSICVNLCIFIELYWYSMINILGVPVIKRVTLPYLLGLSTAERDSGTVCLTENIGDERKNATVMCVCVVSFGGRMGWMLGRNFFFVWLFANTMTLCVLCRGWPFFACSRFLHLDIPMLWQAQPQDIDSDATDAVVTLGLHVSCLVHESDIWKCWYGFGLVLPRIWPFGTKHSH